MTMEALVLRSKRAEGPNGATAADPSHTQAKIARMRRGEPLRVLDLFSGCGGFSLGFQAAGFQIVGNVEIDQLAAQSHTCNFHGNAPTVVQAAHAKARDITKTEPEELARELGLETPLARAVDVIVGGPPCQAFARVGRAKLRQVAEHPEAFRLDPRGNLYLRFLHYIRKFRPLAIVMENVPDVINYGGHNIPEETCDLLEQHGYSARYTLLNSVFYGVPQMRERMFLIAILAELGPEVAFPKPTHWADLPVGYQGSRQVALKHLQLQLTETDAYYLAPPKTTPRLAAAVTAEEALRDLPPIDGHLNGTIKRGTRRLDQFLGYPKGVRLSDFAREMRDWPGLRTEGGIWDHVIRCTPRDYPLFRKMRPGDQYPEAFQLALRLLDEKLAHARTNGAPDFHTSPDYHLARKATVPPYDPSKFPNKWRKMEADMPARTLMAHLGKDTYSHIHYDDSQARMISVREAARLQSFPDAFRFCGTMNPAFRQIGNAVPPLLARAVGRCLKRQLLRPQSQS